MDRKKSGEILRELRGKRSASEVASALNISISALLMYERGERAPRDATKESIAAYYNTTVSDIFFAKQNHDM